MKVRPVPTILTFFGWWSKRLSSGPVRPYRSVAQPLAIHVVDGSLGILHTQGTAITQSQWQCTTYTLVMKDTRIKSICCAFLCHAWYILLTSELEPPITEYQCTNACQQTVYIKLPCHKLSVLCCKVCFPSPFLNRNHSIYRTQKQQDHSALHEHASLITVWLFIISTLASMNTDHIFITTQRVRESHRLNIQHIPTVFTLNMYTYQKATYINSECYILKQSYVWHVSSPLHLPLEITVPVGWVLNPNNKFTPLHLNMYKDHAAISNTGYVKNVQQSEWQNTGCSSRACSSFLLLNQGLLSKVLKFNIEPPHP